MYDDVHRVTDLTTKENSQIDSMGHTSGLCRDHVSVITPHHFHRLSRIADSAKASAKIFLSGFSATPPVLYTSAVPIEHHPGKAEQLIERLQLQGFRFRHSRDVHGCLVTIHGLGVLITGAPGIGKSRLVSQLLKQGHVLVADDVVELESTPVGIVGVAPLTTFGLLLVAGQNSCDVQRQYGVSSLLVESEIAISIHIGTDSVVKTQKMAGFDLPQWYIAAPECHLVYQCLEDYSRGTGMLTRSITKANFQGMSA